MSALDDDVQIGADIDTQLYSRLCLGGKRVASLWLGTKSVTAAYLGGTKII